MIDIVAEIKVYEVVCPECGYKFKAAYVPNELTFPASCGVCGCEFVVTRAETSEESQV